MTASVAAPLPTVIPSGVAMSAVRVPLRNAVATAASTDAASSSSPS
jgi:hypothetical protein